MRRMAPRIEYKRLDKIEPMPENPKDHDIGLLHRSMNRWGFTNVLIIDEQSGKLVAGHGRLKTLTQQQKSAASPPRNIMVDDDGMWRVPVLCGVEFASEAEAKAYLMADNRLTELGGWDAELLTEQLMRLSLDSSADLLDGTGFDVDDLNRILADSSAVEEQAKAATHKRPVRMKVRVGEIDAFTDIYAEVEALVEAHPEWEATVWQ